MTPATPTSWMALRWTHVCYRRALQAHAGARYARAVAYRLGYACKLVTLNGEQMRARLVRVEEARWEQKMAGLPKGKRVPFDKNSFTFPDVQDDKEYLVGWMLVTAHAKRCYASAFHERGNTLTFIDATHLLRTNSKLFNYKGGERCARAWPPFHVRAQHTRTRVASRCSHRPRHYDCQSRAHASGVLLRVRRRVGGDVH